MAKCTFTPGSGSSGSSVPLQSGSTSCQFTPRVGSATTVGTGGTVVAQVAGDESDVSVSSDAEIVFASPTTQVMTLRLPEVISPTSSRIIDIVNRGTQGITIVVDGGGTIEGAASISLAPGANIRVASVPGSTTPVEFVILHP